MKCYVLKKLPLIWISFLLVPINRLIAQTHVLEKQMHHLRSGTYPEWETFSGSCPKNLKVSFNITNNEGEKTIGLKQEDVKYTWRVQLNGKNLGNLYTDENPMVVYWTVPNGLLKKGENTLYIEPEDTTTDDIRVGNMVLFDLPIKQVLTTGRVEVSVTDGKTGSFLPARLTIVNKDGVLQTVGTLAGQNAAIRPGCIYTGNGNVSFGLPEGTYTIYANRGFEYGVDSTKVIIQPGSWIKKKLMISKEVPTDNWISSDTHIHSFTFSHHGDATAEERVLTIAGEEVELPIITEHNLKADFDSIATAMNMRRYFTPVTGYEYTTPVGHFNVFPVTANEVVPEDRVNNWNVIAANLPSSDSSHVIILNHARDIHAGFRPFDPQFHVSSAGWDLRGWQFPANAMEVINSGATQTDYMNLYRDWFGMLNRGYGLTPAGASDSHTVSQYLIGQSRTYIQYKNADAGNLNITTAVKNFREGRVLVSFGLLTEMVVDNRYGPGDVVPSSSNDLTVAVRVMGPGWTKADHIALYANGEKIKEEAIFNGQKPGVKFNKIWKLPRPKQDVFLVAIAEGPGGNNPFWHIAKPYQPASPKWTPKVVGSTGVIWIDGDGDGKRTSAFTYAKSLFEASKNNSTALIKSLASFDKAVAVQAAAILQEQGLLNSVEVKKALEKASPSTKAGFKEFEQQYQLLKAADKMNSSNNLSVK